MKNTIINSESSAAFTGHRTLSYYIAADIRIKLRNLISEWHKKGITNYYCGMAWGFDLLAAECVFLAKREFPDITLTAVIPYREQYGMWDEANRKRYHAILQQVDVKIILSEKYYNGCLLVRNDFMLNHASQLVAFYNGQQYGGTFYTCNKAKQKGMPITNLYDLLTEI